MSKNRFVPGSVYFIVLHADEALMVPVVQTLIYLERRERNGGIEFLFREIKPHEEEALFFVREADADDLIVDRPGLIERLQGRKPT